jgi:hypothetical protein
MTSSASGSRATEGAAALQTNKKSIVDNKYAASWMAERGFPKPVVIGHGGMLTVKRASTPAMVLLSARDGMRRVRTLARSLPVARARRVRTSTSFGPMP